MLLVQAGASQTGSSAKPDWSGFSVCIDIVTNRRSEEDVLPTLTPVPL